MKQLIATISALCLSVSLSAQSFEEQYRAFQQSAKQEYEDFRKVANESYAQFLQAAWEYYHAAPAIPQPKEEPVPPVVYEPPVVEPVPQPLPYEDVAPAPQPAPQPEPIAPVIENDDHTPQTAISFFGTQMAFRTPASVSALHLSDISGQQLAAAWEILSGNDYNNLLYDCLSARTRYQLCDWAYLTMLQRLSATLCGGQTNEAVLLQAFLYANSGYQMRLAASQDGRLYMLVGSKYILYDRGYFDVEGTLFFPLEEITDGVSICAAKFDQEQALTLQIGQEQRFACSASQPITRTSQDGLSARFTINRNLIDFYNQYPTGQCGEDFGTRWEVYADTPLPDAVKQQLYPALLAGIRGVPEAQAVGRLLHWVQTAFEYEYDDKVWGHDRAFFASESLYYPYCDCEDRAILFSRLVRDLLQLDVVLLYYPGHLATAVCFHQDIRGDYLIRDGKKYTICDPTYIGAPPGATMPGMDNQTAKVITLKKQ